jgi:hypothetical protein
MGQDRLLLPLPKKGVLRIFFTLKNPKSSAGFEPAKLGTKGQHATSRPPKAAKVTAYVSHYPVIGMETQGKIIKNH